MRSLKQSNLLENILEENSRTGPKSKPVKKKNSYIFEFVDALDENRELTLNAFKSGIFSLKSTQRKRFKILTTIEILQR